MCRSFTNCLCNINKVLLLISYISWSTFGAVISHLGVVTLILGSETYDCGYMDYIKFTNDFKEYTDWNFNIPAEDGSLGAQEMTGLIALVITQQASRK